MRRILCPIAALAMAGPVSALPARAGELLDFLEYFQATRIVLESSFTDSELDKILSKAGAGDDSGSLSPDVKIKNSIEAALVNKTAEDAKRFLSEPGSLCVLKNKLFTCQISKYEIIRNVGNRSYPSFRNQYDFIIKIRDIGAANRIVEVKYFATSDRK